MWGGVVHMLSQLSRGTSAAERHDAGAVRVALEGAVGSGSRFRCSSPLIPACTLVPSCARIQPTPQCTRAPRARGRVPALLHP
jgi:hypothetical protein